MGREVRASPVAAVSLTPSQRVTQDPPQSYWSVIIVNNSLFKNHILGDEHTPSQSLYKDVNGNHKLKPSTG